MVAEKLDAIPTLTVSIAYPLFVQFILSGQVNTYRLRAGTDAEASPTIIRPDDYAGGTNEKVWELIGYNLPATAPSVTTLTYAASVALDFNAGAYQSVTLTGDITFTTSNRGAGKAIRVRVVGDGSIRNLTFPGWKFIGVTMPSILSIGKTALLKLTGWGSNDSDVTAEWIVEP